MTELLLTTTLAPRQREYAEGARQSGEVLLTLINDILDYSKIEAGKLDLETNELDLEELVGYVATFVGAQAYKKGLEVVAGVSPQLQDPVMGDAGRLRQVLMNLASNAVKFTEQGEIVIRVVLEEAAALPAMIRFTVADSGIGINQEAQDRLFQPFIQADTSTTRKYGGTGLGLVLCKRLVELMGGEIGLASELGQGSTFWFTIPFQLAPGRPTARNGRSTGGLRGLRVLVVDDN
jgi:signal transduction histidine kinase